MSVDERLRASLHDQAQSLSPSVERALHDVQRRGERAQRRSVLSSALAVAAASAAVVGVVLWTMSTRGVRDLPAGPPPTSTVTPDVAANTAPLRGRLDGAVTAPIKLSGAWTLRLAGNGVLGVDAPVSLTGSVTDAHFTADHSSFRTTLFRDDRCRGAGTGIYDWHSDGHSVRFDVVSDSCATRTELLTRTVWTLSTTPPPHG